MSDEKKRRRSPSPGANDGKLSSTELGAIFGVSYKTVNTWVHRRDLPHHRGKGRGLRFVPREIKQYLDEKGHGVPPELRALVEGK